jgi:putative drug exporter of the RND superfamily
VDYNIFLATRAREEAATADARTSIATSLAVTGGVITSAGILLAAVFTVLGVLPLITLTQIGIIVGFGVLLDTLLVRSLLVPSLVALIGDRFWWPGNPRGRGRHRTGRPTTPTQSEHPPPVRGEVLVGRAGPPG